MPKGQMADSETPSGAAGVDACAASNPVVPAAAFDVTQEMIEAGMDALSLFEDHPAPTSRLRHITLAVWEAMISAAPKNGPA